MNRLRTIMAMAAVAGLVFTAVSQTALAASNSLGVNPRRDYTIQSGEKVSDTLDVTNLNKTDELVITIRAIDFGAKDETGSPSLILKSNSPTRWSLKPYLTIPASVTIAPGKSASVPFTIAIPKNVGAGSYYSAIQYSTNGQNGTDGNVSLTSSSATLVFVRVPGEATDSLRIKQFGAFTPFEDKKSGTFASFYGGSAPKYLAFRVENAGNVAEQPNGSIEVKNIFGKVVKTFEKANPDNNLVLIGQTRRFDVCFNEDRSTHNDPETGRAIDTIKCNQSKLAPGRYTAKLALIYGDNGSSSHELGAVASFWYLPLWFDLAVAGSLLVVFGGGIYLVRKQKNKSRYSANR